MDVETTLHGKARNAPRIVVVGSMGSDSVSTDRVWRRFVEDKDKKVPPGWLLDRLADEAENPQHWDQSRKNLCGTCHTYRSRNGSCLCERGE